MRIKSALLTRLQSQVADGDGLECCGILWAREDRLVQLFTPYPGPLFARRFQFADEWLLRRYRWGRAQGLKLWGFYHSHGDNAPWLVPSLTDQAGHPPGSRCLILSSEQRPRAFQFYFEKSGFQELKITIE